MALIKLGVACHKWDHKHKTCSESVDVFNFQGTGASHYRSKLSVDADGAPKAYHPGDLGSFDYLANISSDSLHGIQGQDGAVGPAPGFYVSGTSLSNPAYPHQNDTRHWVDASLVPYIVLPMTAFPIVANATLRKGCVVFVVDCATGGCSGAIFADTGHAVGEGSIALAVRLGRNPISKRNPPKVIGFEKADFFHIVFPTVVVAPPWPVATIQQVAEREFAAWGGEAVLRQIIPTLPPLKPPVDATVA